MNGIALLLVAIRFFAGAFDASDAKLWNIFNIFNDQYSAQEFANSLNYLIGPMRNISVPDITLNSSAAIITDLDSERTLYSKNADTELPMASITKLMTALVALDHYNNQLNTVVSVPAEAVATTGSKMSLIAHENLTILNLLKGTLIASANDAATTLAYAVAGSPEAFVVLMNEKASSLGLTHTSFTNPIGFDADGHHSTARELASLARTALDNPTIAQIVATQKTTVKDTSGKFVHQLVSTNKLLGQYQNVIGVKTGTTEEAGESLVTAVRGDSGQRVVVVLLDSPDRFQEGKKALDWALKAYAWIQPL